MALNADAIKDIVRYSLNVPEASVGCYECLDQIDRYSEMVLAGKEIPEALRLIETHLKDCPECEEEFQALLTALRAMNPAR
jgi:hypothetical protein